jgi:hypothetical protein
MTITPSLIERQVHLLRSSGEETERLLSDLESHKDPDQLLIAGRFCVAQAFRSSSVDEREAWLIRSSADLDCSLEVESQGPGSYAAKYQRIFFEIYREQLVYGNNPGIDMLHSAHGEVLQLLESIGNGNKADYR